MKVSKSLRRNAFVAASTSIDLDLFWLEARQDSVIRSCRGRAGGSVSLTAGILWGGSQEGVYDVCGTAQPVRTEGLFTAPPSGCPGCYSGRWVNAQRVTVGFRNLAQKSAAPVAQCSRTENRTCFRVVIVRVGKGGLRNRAARSARGSTIRKWHGHRGCSGPRTQTGNRIGLCIPDSTLPFRW